MTFVLYLDRVCLGQAAPMMQRELGLSNGAMSFIHPAFTLAYALFEIPTGRWGDRYGSRRVLARIVVWWSLFTALTGAAMGFWMLLLVRFLFGAGEAGALPNSARILRQWFPESARGEAQGIVTTGMMLGGFAARLSRVAIPARRSSARYGCSSVLRMAAGTYRRIWLAVDVCRLRVHWPDLGGFILCVVS